jgi:hypothetical protein
MKRYIFIVAAIVLATVSCSRTYDLNGGNEGQAIGFGTWADNLTKAATGRTIGGSSFAAGDYFFVYGYTSGAQTPFNGDKVSTTDATTWTYSPLRFWDRNNDYYDFYAVSPSEDSFAAAADLVNSFTLTSGAFTTNSLTLAGNDNDILVADKKRVLKANYGQVVELNFRHAAALFDLKVRKGSGIGDNGVLKVTSVALENISNTGTFTVSSYDASTNKAAIAWAGSATGSYTGANGVKNTAGTDIISATTAVTTTGDQFLINNLVVMPQDFAANAQRLKISYTITTGAGTAAEQTNTFTDKTYDLILFDKTDYPTDDNTSEDGDQYNDGTKVSGWVDGVHYTYIITIDAEAIVFTATMATWGTDNGYYYILN